MSGSKNVKKKKKKKFLVISEVSVDVGKFQAVNAVACIKQNLNSSGKRPSLFKKTQNGKPTLTFITKGPQAVLSHPYFM